MGLVSKVVKIKWNSKIKKYYESLGYIFTKMGDEFEVKVKDLTKGSNVKVDCLCDCCGELLIWKYQDYNKCVKKDGKTYCKGCADKLYKGENVRKTKLKNGKSFYDLCIERNRQDLLDRWDEELNGCSPEDISYSTSKKYWFKCNRHPEHKSELKNINSFANGCEGSMDCKKCNSIAQYIIDNYSEEFLWIIWSYKNEISPFEVSIRSNKKVWWNCLNDKHESFKRSCDNSVRYEFRCPKCIEEKEESIIEEKVRLYLEELGYEVKTEYSCTIIPVNPKTSYLLPFDNEIVLENRKHLIIEVHGIQHYKLQGKNSKYLKKRKTPEECLHQRKLYDRYKRIKCTQAGYEYLEIPYTAFNKKDSYKKLIDNKIKEILNPNKKSLKNNKQE